MIVPLKLLLSYTYTVGMPWVCSSGVALTFPLLIISHGVRYTA